MTEATPDETQQPAVAPQPEATQDKKEKADKPDEAKGFPVGQAAAGGLGAITLGSYALASVVGPLGWLAAPAAATAAGAGYVAYRRRKSRGGQERTVKTTTTKSSGSRASGGLLGGGRAGAPASGRSSGATTSAKRSGGLPTAGSGGGSAAGKGGSPVPGSRGSAARPGGAPRQGGGGAAPRSGGGGTTPRPGSGARRTPGGDTTGQRRTGGSTPRGGGEDTSTSKRKTSPPGGTGTRPGSSPRTPGGRMSENRWGGTSGPTQIKKPGAIRRGAAKARDWADDKTGRKVSTGWKAARGQEGFKNRRKAAGQAVRDAGGGGFIAGLVGLIAALFGKGSRSPKKDTASREDIGTPDGWYGRDGHKLGDPVPGNPGSYHADPTDDRPGYVNRAGLGPDHPGYTTGSYDSNVDPRTWGERVAAGDAPDFSTTTSTGGTTMSGLPAAQIAHDMAAAMARYEPTDAWAVVAESKQWPDVSTQAAMAVKAYADRLEGARFPLNPAIIGKLQEYFQALAASRAIAEELHPLLQKAHADDIAKQDAPRGDESKWNV